MCYIIRLDYDNFVIIDGGIKLTSKTEKPTLLEFVQAPFREDVKK